MSDDSKITVDEKLKNLFPKFICPICKDWFHMPYKYCRCDRDPWGEDMPPSDHPNSLSNKPTCELIYTVCTQSEQMYQIMVRPLISSADSDFDTYIRLCNERAAIYNELTNRGVSWDTLTKDRIDSEIAEYFLLNKTP